MKPETKPAEQQECAFVGVYGKCLRIAEFLVMTQIPPYTQEYVCGDHLLTVTDRLLGIMHCPVLIRRVRLPEDWTWS